MVGLGEETESVEMPPSPSGLWHLPCKQEGKPNRQFESDRRLATSLGSIMVLRILGTDMNRVRFPASARRCYTPRKRYVPEFSGIV